MHAYNNGCASSSGGSKHQNSNALTIIDDLFAREVYASENYLFSTIAPLVEPAFLKDEPPAVSVTHLVITGTYKPMCFGCFMAFLHRYSTH
jgi:hypothetical protein